MTKLAHKPSQLGSIGSTLYMGLAHDPKAHFGATFLELYHMGKVQVGLVSGAHITKYALNYIKVKGPTSSKK